ncbi:FliH/SctL family protein [Planctomicrobium sp. SH527]|uniref:FliH/SctL family protein n=1 Tax=Planctomicrobium sp. SH527 TaxID=3448123 RepID=UPI003F5AF233
MTRQSIHFTVPPSGIRLRGGGTVIENEIPPVRPLPVVAPPVFRQESAKLVQVPTAPPEPDLRPLLNAIADSVAEVEERRKQSLGELQHVAIELAIAVASQLVYESLSREQFGVEKLVSQIVERMGVNGPITVSLNPADLALLQRRMTKLSVSWNSAQVELKGEPALAPGSCRAESPDGRMLVSEVTSRLSEIRRHWMEELDDAQIERRRPDGEGPALRRFPDRREIA